jgi:hypothetical protein
MKIMRVKSLGLLGIALALALTACSSGSGSSSNPSNFPNCTAPGSFVGIYPENGATNVSDGIQQVYVASSVTLGSQYQNVISAGGGTPYYGNSFTQVTFSQVPTPHTNPGFANPIYYTVTFPNLSAGTQYTMYLNNQNSQNCVPLQYLQFTTQ